MAKVVKRSNKNSVNKNAIANSAKKISKDNINNIKTYRAIITEYIIKYLKLIIIGSLFIIVFYPPFLRGLYFEKEQLKTEILIFAVYVLFWAYKLLKKDRQFLKTPIDYAAFGLTAVYFLSIFTATGTRAAVSEWLKYCMYFAIFFMLSELAVQYKFKITFLWVMIASAFGVSILGLDGAAGGKIAGCLNALFKALGAKSDVFFGLYEGNRIFSTLQYPNTLAAYLLAVFFIACGTIAASEKIYAKMAAAAICFTYMITFIFTMSRGAYLILPVSIVIFAAALPKHNKLKAVTYAISIIIVAAAASIKFSEYITNPAQNLKAIWTTVAAGMAASSIIILLVNFITKYTSKINMYIKTIVCVAALIFILIGTMYVFSSTSPLELKGSAENNAWNKSAAKTLVLKPDTEYKLIFDVEASAPENKVQAYKIEVLNKTEKNIMFGGASGLAVFEGGITQGPETKEVVFKVPDETSCVVINFTNIQKESKTIFHNARIVENTSGRIVKNIKLQYKYIPQSITARFDQILTDKSGIQRKVYYKDALKIIKDRWLLGAGGGSWPLLYFSHQSYLYWSTQPHNYFIQIAVETGILGILLILTLIASIVITFIKKYRIKGDSSIQERIIQSALLTAILTLFMHSAIDFDLSLAAVSLTLWEMVGMYNGE